VSDLASLPDRRLIERTADAISKMTILSDFRGDHSEEQACLNALAQECNLRTPNWRLYMQAWNLAMRGFARPDPLPDDDRSSEVRQQHRTQGRQQ